jgi:hypothetical protein
VKKLLLMLLMIAPGMGCHLGHNQIVGSGKLFTDKREVGSFSSISTEGAFDVRIVCQKPQSLEIEGDDNILPLITTEVSNNVLRIRTLRNYSVSEPIRLTISVPDLEGIYSSGAGTIQVSEINNKKLQVDANGAPTIRVSGQTNDLTIDTNGAGKIDTHRLHSARVTVDSKGVSQVEVYAGEQLDATVSGPSHVTYAGDPQVRKTINGPGSVEKRESEGS